MKFKEFIDDLVKLADCPDSKDCDKDDARHQRLTLSPKNWNQDELGNVEIVFDRADWKKLKQETTPLKEAFWKNYGGIIIVSKQEVTVFLNKQEKFDVE